MATFKPIIFKERQREDKTWTVFIRFTHERKMRYIATTMYVGKKEIRVSPKTRLRSFSRFQYYAHNLDSLNKKNGMSATPLN